MKTAHSVSASDDTHMAYVSYGYEPVSAQYILAMAAGDRIVAPQELEQRIDGDSRTLAGMQYAAEAGQHVFDPYGLRSKHSVDGAQAEKLSYGQVWASMQYAAEAGQDVFDPYGLQPTQLSDSRQKIEKLTPLS